MKIGEILYCKKTLTYSDTIRFKKNKLYKCASYYISVDRCTIKDEINKEVPFSLSLNSNDGYKFHEHFIKLKNLRKLKLQKLKN